MRGLAKTLAAGIFAILTSLCATLPTAQAQTTFSPQEISALVGGWSINWQGARDKYAGRVDISNGRNAAELVGKVTLLPQSGGTVVQEARITTTGLEIRIECHSPKVIGRTNSTWNPDRFYVTLSGNEMRGHSVDSAGQRGTLIILTKL